MKTIALYALRELHLPILERVFWALKETLPHANIVLTAPEFLMGTSDWPEEGLQTISKSKWTQMGVPFMNTSSDSQFDIVITADACYDRVDGWGPVICVGHGTISKNIFFIDEPSCRRENYADVLCVPGPWYQNCFGNFVHTEIEPTGFPKLDALVEDHRPHTQSLIDKLKWQHKKIVLYAPTYNLEMCSLPFMEDSLIQLAKAGYAILVKLHGATQEDYRKQYRALASSHCQIHYLEDQDIIPWMQLSDLLISDVSSVYVEYLPLNKPIFLYDHAQLTQCDYYNPKAVEFKVRESAYRFSDPQILLPLVQKVEQTDGLTFKRQQFAAELFPPLDGKNSHRVSLVAKKLLENPQAFPNYRKEFHYVLLADRIQETDLQVIQQTLKQLAFQIKPRCSWVTRRNFKDKPNWNFVEWTDINATHPMSYKILLDGSHMFPKHMDRVISMYLSLWVPGALWTSPLLSDNDQNYYQKQSLVLNQRLESTEEKIQNYAKHVLFHQHGKVKASLWDGSCIHPSIFKIWMQYYHENPHDFDWYYFHQILNENEIHPLVLMGQYGYNSNG